MKYLLTALFGIPNLVTGTIFPSSLCVFTAIILVNTNIGFCFSDEKAYTHILIIAQSFGEYRHKILFLR